MYLVDLSAIYDKGDISCDLLAYLDTKNLLKKAVLQKEIQSNFVISNSLIENYRLFGSENLIPILTWNYDNR